MFLQQTGTKEERNIPVRTFLPRNSTESLRRFPSSFGIGPAGIRINEGKVAYGRNDLRRTHCRPPYSDKGTPPFPMQASPYSKRNTYYFSVVDLSNNKAIELSDALGLRRNGVVAERPWPRVTAKVI